MTDDALNELDFIRSTPGTYAGQIDERSLAELLEAGLVEKYYDGMGGFIGLAKVRVAN